MVGKSKKSNRKEPQPHWDVYEDDCMVESYTSLKEAKRCAEDRMKYHGGDFVIVNQIEDDLILENKNGVSIQVVMIEPLKSYDDSDLKLMKPLEGVDETPTQFSVLSKQFATLIANNIGPEVKIETLRRAFDFTAKNWEKIHSEN